MYVVEDERGNKMDRPGQLEETEETKDGECGSEELWQICKGLEAECMDISPIYFILRPSQDSPSGHEHNTLPV